MIKILLKFLNYYLYSITKTNLQQTNIKPNKVYYFKPSKFFPN